MKKRKQKNLCITMCLFALFILWTIAVRYLDVRAIGPKSSSVGFATLNGFFHKLTGVHMKIYTITDWLGLIPLFIVFGFALLGLVQLIKRRSLLKVDYSILVLGVFYVIVMSVYVLFEKCIINYRPVLIEGHLEASYPSSTTMLVMCVMPTAVMQLKARIKKEAVRKCFTFAMITFMVFMVLARLVSGVHWLTDIVGGALISSALVMLYDTIINSFSGEYC